MVSAPTGPGCDPAALAGSVAGRHRVLAYVGVLYGPYKQANQVVAARLSALGPLQVHALSAMSFGYTVDLAGRPAQATVPDTAYNCLKVG
jgi:hypothetical protein